MATAKPKVYFISGASRGIGLAIAKRVARDGAAVAIAAKTSEPHPSLPGTVHSAAKEIEEAGGKALPLVCDIRKEEEVQAAVEATVAAFGGIDVCVNNASAISLTGTLDTSMKKYDLMQSVNARGTFVVSKACIPHLLRSSHTPHILALSPPLSLSPRWFGPHVAYSIAKYGMSLTVLGLAEEFRGKISVNALWPRTTIATSAVKMLGGDSMLAVSRSPEIVADAAAYIFAQNLNFTGKFCIDEDLLRASGVSEEQIEAYAMVRGSELLPDFFVD